MRAMSNLIGKTVRLTFKNTSPVLTGPFKDTEPTTIDIVGQVMDSRHKGCYIEPDQDVFFLSVPHSELPIRAINIKRVIAVDGNPIIHEKTSEQVWEAKSSRGDQIYKVKLFDGNWSCECVANANFRKTCRHIQEIQKQIGVK